MAMRLCYFTLFLLLAFVAFFALPIYLHHLEKMADGGLFV